MSFRSSMPASPETHAFCNLPSVRDTFGGVAAAKNMYLYSGTAAKKIQSFWRRQRSMPAPLEEPLLEQGYTSVPSDLARELQEKSLQLGLGLRKSFFAAGGRMQEKYEDYKHSAYEEYKQKKKLATKVAFDKMVHEYGTPALRRILDQLGDIMKENCQKDPDMWPRVREWIKQIVDSLWEDLETEIETGLKSAALKAMKKDKAAQQKATAANGAEQSASALPPANTSFFGLWRLFLRLRAMVLCAYLPHNKSIFGKLGDPMYVVMVISTMLPIFGIRVFFFSVILLMLLLPGPPDEFQLINYILIFKGTQFFTTGVGLGFFGAMQYYFCYLFGGEDLRSCNDLLGPGTADYLPAALVDYFGTIILVWVAFLALPKSKRQEHPQLHGFRPRAGGNDDHKDSSPHDQKTGAEQAQTENGGNTTQQDEVYCFCLRGNVQRGGRLRKLLLYDACCFAFSSVVFLLIYCVATKVSHLDAYTHAKQTIFWCRIFYSLLSLPFIVFIIPGVLRMLTHSVFTGYDANGMCVEFDFDSPPVATQPEHAKAV